MVGKFVDQWFKGIQHYLQQNYLLEGQLINELKEGPEEKDEIYSLKACITSKEQTKLKKASFHPI